MTISVIIPTYNGKAKILGTIHALRKQSHTNFETIVVIDGSNDGTYDLLEASNIDLPNFHILNQDNKGRAGARNAGVAKSTGELLIFLDDDMEPIKELVSRHLQHHTQHPISVLVGNQLERIEEMETDFQHFKSYLSRKWTAQTVTDDKDQLKQPFITAANFSIPHRLFEELNGFDESMTDAEDRELAIRCFEKNIPIYFKPDILAWHHDLITAKGYTKRLGEYQKATQQLKEMHPDYFASQKNAPFSKFKQWIYVLSSQPVVVWLIDHFNIFLLFPKVIRYRYYELMVTGISLRHQRLLKN